MKKLQLGLGTIVLLLSFVMPCLAGDNLVRSVVR